MKQPNLSPILYRSKEFYLNIGDFPFLDQVIPDGFLLDGSSIPRFLWSFKPPDGLHRLASAVHDWLYANKGWFENHIYTRKECDRIFYDYLLLSGVSKSHSWIMYKAVRMFGGSVWKKPKEIIILPTTYMFKVQKDWKGHLYDIS